MDTAERRSSRRHLLIFALLVALVSVASFFGLRQLIRADHLEGLGDRELRLTQVFQARMAARLRAVHDRIRGVELLVSSTPPSASTASKALLFGMGRKNQGETYSAAIALDQRAQILADRRNKGVSSAGSAEKKVWKAAAAALRNNKKGEKNKASRNSFHVDAGSINGVSVLYFTFPSRSTKGYWGIIFSAKDLLSIKDGEIGPSDSLFLVTEPEQTVLYARRGNRFLQDSIGRPFDKGLGAVLNVVACCDPSAFNTLHEGQRWMTQANLSGGTRKLRFVRVAERAPESVFQSRTERFISGSLFAVWIILVGAFHFLNRGRDEDQREREPRVDLEENVTHSISSKIPFEGLSQISEFVARGDHFKDVINFGVKEVSQFIQADRYYAALYDEELDQLFDMTALNLSEGYRATIVIGSGEMPEHIAVKEKDFVEVPYLEDWDEAPEWLKEEGFEAMAVFPMRAGEKIVGLMAFYFNEPRELNPEEAEICNFFALQGASAVSRALSISEPPPTE